VRKPSDSLDQFRKPAFERLKPQQPATEVRITGEVERLEPLAVWDGVIRHKSSVRSLSVRSWYRFSSFHRSLALGTVLGLIALMLGTGMFLRMDRPPIEPVIVSNERPEEELPGELDISNEAPFTSDLVSTEDATSAFDKPSGFRRTPKRSTARLRKMRSPVRAYSAAVQRPRHHLPSPQFWVSQFVPTTLVIFAENGEIKTHIEPQSYKKLRSN